VARRLGVPVETVRTRLKRALAHLKRRLDHEHGGDRRSWVLALLPLASLHAEAAAGAGATLGALIMSTKAKAAAGIVVLLILAATVLVWRLTGPHIAPPDKPARERARSPDPEPPGEAPPPVAPPAAVAHVVRGEVVDEEGKPVADASVAIVAVEDPFGDGDTLRLGNYYGRRFPTDASGALGAELPGPRRVMVYPLPTPGFQPDEGQERWVDTPATGLRITGTRMPTALVRVRVTDLSTGKRLPRFVCAFTGPEFGYLHKSAVEGVLEVRLRLAKESGEATVKVTLIDPKRPEPVTREVTLRTGEERELSLSFKSGERILGVVFDSAGNPVRDAIVFFGNQIRARGDEPFKPFDMRRIRDGATTGEGGRFELAGDGREVTVWHPELSPVTVPLVEATQITLPPRSAIRGRLLDAAGKPVVGIEVAMDRVRKATTDEEGRFTFDKVAAGVRGLMLPGKRFAGARVEPGETAEVELSAGIEKVSFTLVTGEEPYAGPERRSMGVLVGLADVFTLHPFRLEPGQKAFEATGVPAGEYLLLSSGGLVAKLAVTGPEATVDLGDADLTVTGKPGTRVYVVPRDCADELSQLLGGRVAPRAIEASGEARFSPLPKGRYAVGIDRLGIFATVDVAGPGARVALP
jgi:hypothetical protein